MTASGLKVSSTERAALKALGTMYDVAEARHDRTGRDTCITALMEASALHVSAAMRAGKLPDDRYVSEAWKRRGLTNIGGPVTGHGLRATLQCMGYHTPGRDGPFGHADVEALATETEQRRETIAGLQAEVRRLQRRVDGALIKNQQHFADTHAAGRARMEEALLAAEARLSTQAQYHTTDIERARRDLHNHIRSEHASLAERLNQETEAVAARWAETNATAIRNAQESIDERLAHAVSTAATTAQDIEDAAASHLSQALDAITTVTAQARLAAERLVAERVRHAETRRGAVTQIMDCLGVMPGSEATHTVPPLLTLRLPDTRHGHQEIHVHVQRAIALTFPDSLLGIYASGRWPLAADTVLQPAGAQASDWPLVASYLRDGGAITPTFATAVLRLAEVESGGFKETLADACHRIANVWALDGLESAVQAVSRSAAWFRTVDRFWSVRCDASRGTVPAFLVSAEWEQALLNPGPVPSAGVPQPLSLHNDHWVSSAAADVLREAGVEGWTWPADQVQPARFCQHQLTQLSRGQIPVLRAATHDLAALARHARGVQPSAGSPTPA